MEKKTMNKKTLVSLSTIVACAKCKHPNAIHEMMYEDGNNYYHVRCASDGDTKKAAETKVHTLHLNDDLSVKSEGR
jgi:hypothetical protein